VRRNKHTVKWILEIEIKKDRLGKYTISGLVDLFKTLQPAGSASEQEMWKKAFGGQSSQQKPQSDQIENKEAPQNKEHDSYDQELKARTYFEAEGFEFGKKDQELFEKLKDANIDQNIHPNLHRWRNLVAHHSNKK